MNEELGLKIFNILNKYYFVDDFLEVLDLIKEDFKEAFIKPLNNKNALDLIPLNSFLIEDTDYIFLMGFNLENIPKTYKDIDYLSDDLKSKIGLFTSLEKNINERITTLYHLKNIKNLVITYKDSDAYQSYYPSNLISELGKSVDLFDSLNNTSNLYNKIKLTKKLDTFLKYGEEEDGTAILLNTYKDIPYLTYDNKYKGINKKIQNIRLSYTSLDNFYHCQFRFYIDSILKLNIYEDNFKLLIGNLFHYVLSKMYSEDFNLESTWNEFLESKKFSKKEEFYLEILKEELVEIIEILKQHYELTGLTNIKTESEINLEYPDNFKFKGIIDKIMYKEKNNETYVSLIDYKTGTPKTNMTNLIYGIDMQLPIYAYLIKKSNLFLNPKIIGFYFEQIIHEPLSYTPKKTYKELKKDSLKLEGYSIDDSYLVNMFDSSYENSEMIRGMKVSSKGFYYYTKVLTEDAIDKLVSIVDDKIKEAFEEIKEANFIINPKVIEKDNIGCKYCKYQDLWK